VELVVIRLAADPETIRQRLSGRDSGSVLQGHLAEAADFERRIEEAALQDATVRNDGAPVRTIAERVLETAGW
jgi:dephospho-CoA kinase